MGPGPHMKTGTRVRRSESTSVLLLARRTSQRAQIATNLDPCAIIKRESSLCLTWMSGAMLLPP